MEDEDRRPDRTSVGWCGRGRVQNTFAGYASTQNRQRTCSFSTPHAGQGRAGAKRGGGGEARDVPRMRAMASTTASSKAALSLIIRPKS